MFTDKKLITVLFYGLFLVQTLFSQITLEGVVSDYANEPVENALVKLTDQSDPARLFSTYTNQQGQYSFILDNAVVENISHQLPQNFSLHQNYPNPFNPSTIIEYQIKNPANISIEIFNVLGRKVKTLISGFQTNLTGSIRWNATDDFGQGVSAGIYIYSMTLDGVRITKKMVLLDGNHINYSLPQPRQSYTKFSHPKTLEKTSGNEYQIRVTGQNIEPFEQNGLVITSNTNLDLKVWRTVADIDGNVYRTIKIGDQCWMAENLKVTHYRNGALISNVADSAQWRNTTSEAYCNYGNSENNTNTYGLLYNWYAVIDNRSIAPTGWHVPSDEEWKELEMYLGMSRAAADTIGPRGTDEGGKMKETGTAHWNSPNSGATDEIHLSVLPGGFRYNVGKFFGMGDFAYFWSFTENMHNTAWSRYILYNGSSVYRYDSSKQHGLSVRCVKD